MRIISLGGLALAGSSLRRPKPLTLLAFLALEGSQDRRFLAELFWPRAADPRKSLTVALARLRAAAPELVESDRTHVRSDAAIDVHDLLEALEDGRLDDALDLYGGPFLHGPSLPGAGPELEEWVYATREFIAERVALALIDVAERDASDGGARRGVPRAEAAFRLVDPSRLSEHDLARLHALLARGGSPLARRLHAGAQELGVQLAEVPTENAARSTRAPARPVATARSSTLDLTTRNRRLRATGPFVGRSDELEAALGVLRAGDDRLLSVTGPPGVGKTRLALEIARRLEQERGEVGLHFVPLEHVDQPELLAPHVADVLGLEPTPGAETWPRVVRSIGARPDVLFLDDFEQLIQAGPQLVDLLASCPNLRIVVTTRMRLKLTVERVLALEGLPFAAGPSAHPHEAASSDAVRLFVQRARRHRHSLPVDRRALELVLAICRSTGGLPLALELAAAWARALPLEDIVADLEHGLDLLETDAADRPERQRGMRSAVERSWRLLRPRERSALARLTVFAGDFDRHAAGAVADVSTPRLAALIDASLLRWDGFRRYGFHPPIRRFVRDRALVDPDLLRVTEERHASYFLERMADRPDAFRRGSTPGRSEDPRHDLDDQVAAWRWAVGAERRDLLEAAVEPFGWLLYMRGRTRLGLELMAAAEPYCRSGPPARFRAMYLTVDGRAPESVALMERTLEAAPTAPPLERAHQLRVLGVARHEGSRADPTASERDFREALELYQRSGDDEGTAMILNNLANLARDPHVGLTLARDAERTAARGRVHHARAIALTTQAELQLWFIGAYRAAAAAAGEAVRLHGRTGFEALVPTALLVRAEAHLALGLRESVERDVRALAEAARGVPRGIVADWRADGHALRARMARVAGDRAAAASAARAALAEEAIGGGNAHGSAHLLLARLALEDGRLDDADAAIAELVRASVSQRAVGPGAPDIVSSVGRACVTAAVAADRGRIDEAESQLFGALLAAQRVRSFPSCLTVAAAVATLRLLQGRTAEAAHLRQLVTTHPAAHAETRATFERDRRVPAGASAAAAPLDDAPPPSALDDDLSPSALDDVVRELLASSPTS